MSSVDEYPHAERLRTRPPHGGWTGLQLREGDAVLHWLQREQRLNKGFDALALALRATFNDLVRTASDARAVWCAAPAILRNCNDPETYSIPQAATAYAWLHMLDRYVRTWLAFDHLLRSRLLPMGKFGIRALDVGTGPGPSAFATHDFFAAIEEYALATASPHWKHPPEITCVDPDPHMNRIRHLVSEQLENNLRNQYYEFFNEDRGDWDADPVYTAEEANRIANSHHRYRLFTFSNFLTTLDMVSTFQDNIEEILTDAHAGSVLLMIGATGGCYPTIRKRIAKLAEVGRFRRQLDTFTVASAHSKLDQRVGEEVRSFYYRLKHLAVDLPANGNDGAKLRRELEDNCPMTFKRSTILAFRK